MDLYKAQSELCCNFVLELDMNCDFSSNNDIWARFYKFLWQPF